MQSQVEVRNITKKISDLNCKLDTVSTLSEPRENSYIEYMLSSSPNQRHENDPAEILGEMDGLLTNMGQIKTSKTFPSLCRATMDTAIANLEMIARVTTIDYNGVVQDHGGDPVMAEIIDDKGSKVALNVEDKDDGTYEVKFTAHRAGTYCLKVRTSSSNFFHFYHFLFEISNFSRKKHTQTPINHKLWHLAAEFSLGCQKNPITLKFPNTFPI